MFSIPHLVVIFVVALIIFGPEKLPDLARNLGKLMGEFQRYSGDLRSTLEGHLKDIEREGENRKIAGPATVTEFPAAQTPAAAPASPGTIPSKPPNAAALTPSTGDLFPPPPTDAAEPGEQAKPSVSEVPAIKYGSDRENDGNVRPA